MLSCRHVSTKLRGVGSPILTKYGVNGGQYTLPLVSLNSMSIMSTRHYISLRDWILGIDPHEETKLVEFHQDFPQSQLIKGRYISPWSRQTEKSTSATLKWLLNRKQNKLKLQNEKNRSKTDFKELLKPLTLSKEDLVSKIQSSLSSTPTTSEGGHNDDTNSSQPIQVSWLGHATVHVHLQGVNFLTDPMFSERASPFQFLGPKRFFPSSLSASDVPVDVVLLSHTHYDHLDMLSARDIGNKALWVVPLGVKELLKSGANIDNCIELNWWQDYTYTNREGQDVKITFAPTKHWTSRTFFDRNTCLWGSFVVSTCPSTNTGTASPVHVNSEAREERGQRERQQGQSFYFGGDTAYCDKLFKNIGDRYGPFDLSLIPIGAYKPRYFMKDHHCDPKEALQIHQDLQSKRSVAIHWGTFPLADEDVIEPALELGYQRHAVNMETKQFFTMRLNESLTLPLTEQQEAEFSVDGDFSVLHPDLMREYTDWSVKRERRAIAVAEKKAARLSLRKQIVKDVRASATGRRQAKVNIHEHLKD